MTNTICTSSGNDKLFFLLWRNIVIRNVIIYQLNESNFGKHKFGYFKYDQIVKTSWMIEYGYLELLKLKVKNGHYLAFMNLNEKDFNSRTIKSKYDDETLEQYIIGTDRLSIFNKDKDGLLDYGFYLNLFKNYSATFNTSNSHLTFSIILEYDNEIALKSLINSFGNLQHDQVNFKSFYKCIEIGSFKCAFLIYELLSKLNKSNLLLIWEMVIENNYYRSSMIDKRVEFILDKCKYPIINLICDPSIYDYSIHTQKLNVLVNSVITILSIKELLVQFINSLNCNSFKLNLNGFTETEITGLLENEKIIQSFNQIDLSSVQDIVKFQFTNDQLEMTVNEFKSVDKYGCNAEIDMVVFQIVKFLIPFTNHYTHVKDNYHYFNAKYNNQFVKKEVHGVGSYHSLFHPVLFGYYDWEDIKLNGLLIGKKSIFNYCKNEKQKQLNYIDNLIKDLKSSIGNDGNSGNIQKLKTYVFIYLVEHNDIELLSHYYNQLDSSSFNFKNIPSSIGRVYKNIKSIEIFDFIQSIIGKLVTGGGGGSGTDESSTTILLKSLISNDVPYLLVHFKSKYRVQYIKEISNIKKSERLNDCSVVSIGTFKFIYKNISDFMSIYECISYWDSTPYFEILNPSYQDYIELISLTPQHMKYAYSRIPANNTDNRIFNYIVNKGIYNYSKGNDTRGIIGRRCVPSSAQDLHAFHYFNNLQSLSLSSYYIGLPKIKDPSVLFRLIDLQIGYYGNNGFIDYFYNGLFFKDVSCLKEKFISCVFKSACTYGRIDIYKYLESNYFNVLQSIFSKSTKDNFSLHLVAVIKSGSIDLFSLILNSFFKINQPIVIPKGVELLTFSNQLLINHFKSIFQINSSS